ncbi:MAG: polysaccharide biosynthesis protein [Cellulosilyticum sp.]|nr:polysaccharide biosynthesis protein [Cellulosilyticum sp.]
MKQENKYNILSGTLILSGGVLISRVIGFLYRIPIQKIIGNVGQGLYGDAYQIYTFILTVTAIAMPSALSKLIAESETLKRYGQSEQIFRMAVKYATLCALLLGGLIFFGADVISDVAFPGDDIGGAIRVFAPTAVIATFIASLRGYFQGLGDMKPTAISQIFEQIVNVIVSIGLAYYFSKISIHLGVIGSCIGTAVGAIIALVILGGHYKQVRKERSFIAYKALSVEDERKMLKKLLHNLVPIIVSTSVFAVMSIIDFAMISHLLPDAIMKLQEIGETYFIPIKSLEGLDIKTIVQNLKGQYSFQYNTFINIPVSLILQLAVASIPALSADMVSGDCKAVNQKMNMIMKTGMLFATPASIAFMIFGVPMMQLILGSSASGGELLAVGGIGMIGITIAQLTAGILQGIGKAKRACIHAVIACIVKVIFNFVLMRIPQLNIFSVVIATGICYLVYSIMNVVYLYKVVVSRILWKEVLVKPLFCSVIMGIGAYSVFKLLCILSIPVRISMLLTIPFAISLYYRLARRVHIMLPEVEDFVAKHYKRKVA